MINCLLVRITRNQLGQAIREEHRVSGEELSIGRGEECTIHLADPRANLHFASIKHSKDGILSIDGEGTLLNIDGMYEHQVTLEQGAHILLGPYELVVEKLGGDHDLALSVELIHPLATDGDAVKKATPRSLTETGLSKRKLAYWLAGITLMIFLVAPLVTSLSPSARTGMAHSGVFPNKLWNPGMMSPGHSSFGSQCSKCHEAPFRPVRNEACLSCHTEVGQHLATPHLDKHVFKETRCTECHFDHQNSRPIAMQGANECIVCHSDVKAKHAKSDIPDIHDFGTDHPDFRLTFTTGINASDVQRVAQTDTGKLVENSGLDFPHELHVGLVQVPGDMDTIKDMKCVACHQPDAAGKRFLPISMKQHCFACHQDQLEFNLAPEGRKLPHGSVAELSNTLRDYYASLAFNDKKSIEWVNEQLEKTTKSLTEGNGCDYCHTVAPVKDGNNLLKVTPQPHITQNWFPAAKFPHAKHQAFKCMDCHKVEQSAKSSDIAIPAIQSCKQCHTGNQPSGNKVISNCISCHAFHMQKTKSP